MQYDNYIAPPSHPAIYKSTTDHGTKKTYLPSPTIPKRAQTKKLQNFNINQISKSTLDSPLQPYKSNKMSPIFSSLVLPLCQITSKIPDCAPIRIASPSLNLSIRKDMTKSDLVQFLHCACFLLKLTTWCLAIANNFFTIWPGQRKNWFINICMNPRQQPLDIKKKKNRDCSQQKHNLPPL